MPMPICASFPPAFEGERDGEPAFRQMELSILREVLGSPEHVPHLLALGGGAFVQSDVQKCLDEASVATVFLDAPASELFLRCEQPNVNRPLRRDPEQFRTLYEKRRPEYLKATFSISTGGKSVESVVDEILQALKLSPGSGVFR